ncbi:MAG: SDR family NAD(P)-dependent oxidoreductase [Paludibacter sp.]|nr:SDR family NAD(P)-dependent oxidoreductase [Paludibacter sp.]
MKKAIIIGATSGIGKALAALLIENDFQVGITGRRTNLLEEIKSTNPNRYFIKSFDIKEVSQINQHLNDLTLELGGLDLLIISSGTGDLNEKLEFEIEKRTIDTNIIGFTAIADWAFNFFQNQKHGQLVAISSIAGLRGNHLAPSYSASKAYQINYLESLRIKASKSKLPIYITDIRPGFVNTEMAKGDGLFWVSSVEKAANQIFKAIYKNQKVAYVTKRWGVLACIMKSLPSWAIEKM